MISNGTTWRQSIQSALKEIEFLRREIARLNQRMILLQKDNDNLYGENLRLRKELQSASRSQQ